MPKEKKRKKFLSFYTQSRILMFIALLLFIATLILIKLNKDASRAEAGSKSLYDVAGDMEAAKARLGTGEAALMNRSADKNFKFQLVFEGISSPVVIDRILALLEEYDMDAIFCASAVDAVENADVLQLILSKGYRVGSYCTRGESHVDKLSSDELIKTFCTSRSYIEQATGMTPKLLRCHRSQHSAALRDAANAAGYSEILDVQGQLGLQSFSSFSSVQRYVNSQAPYGLISLRLIPGPAEDASSASTPAPAPTGAPAAPVKTSGVKPAADMQEMVKRDEDWVDMSANSDTERAMLLAEWLIRANAEADFSPEAEELRVANAGRLAPFQDTLYTTKRGICLMFGGLGENNAELTSLLSALKEMDAVATFAITLDEARSGGDAIRAVLKQGHTVEAAIRPGANSDYYQLCSQLLLCRKLLGEKYGISCAKLCVTLGHSDSAAMAEAASAAGCEQIGCRSSLPQSEGDNALGAQDLLSKTFASESACLRRGDIFYLPLNFYDDPATLSEAAKLLYTQRNVYPVCALRELAGAQRYSYPVPEESWLSGIADIKPGHIKSEDALMDIIAAHYLGCSGAASEENLPGFNDDERGRLNTKGLISTKERVAFLTFDDWGTDANIDPLLQVLKAHDVKGAFFIRSNHVDANPNLLRAIAEDGHEVGSHTHQHLPLSDAIGDTMVYESLTTEELATLQDDLQTSWYTLAGIVGDMKSGERPSLIKIFRPPTLAVSKNGLKTVFDLGFEYVASGSYSTHDYEADNAQALYTELRANLKSGAVFVMHMSAQAKYTPEALDMLFTYNEQLPASKQFRFGLLGDYLDGTAEIDHPY